MYKKILSDVSWLKTIMNIDNNNNDDTHLCHHCGFQGESAMISVLSSVRTVDKALLVKNNMITTKAHIKHLSVKSVKKISQ